MKEKTHLATFTKILLLISTHRPDGAVTYGAEWVLILWL
jgi:hypothetical protein